MENVVIDQMGGYREGYKALVAARGENRPLITVSNHQASMWPSTVLAELNSDMKQSTNLSGT